MKRRAVTPSLLNGFPVDPFSAFCHPFSMPRIAVGSVVRVLLLRTLVLGWRTIATQQALRGHNSNQSQQQPSSKYSRVYMNVTGVQQQRNMTIPLKCLCTQHKGVHHQCYTASLTERIHPRFSAIRKHHTDLADGVILWANNLGKHEQLYHYSRLFEAVYYHYSLSKRWTAKWFSSSLHYYHLWNVSICSRYSTFMSSTIPGSHQFYLELLSFPTVEAHPSLCSTSYWFLKPSYLHFSPTSWRMCGAAISLCVCLCTYLVLEDCHCLKVWKWECSPASSIARSSCCMNIEGLSACIRAMNLACLFLML